MSAQSNDFVAACEIVRTLQRAGHQAYFVGGYVRDLILGRLHAASEIDLVTSATVEEISELFVKCQFQGARFGVIQVSCQSQWFDVATLRVESGYHNARHPDHVQMTTSISADVLRRDFTINGLYYDPLADEIIDQVGAIADLAGQRLRAIGQAGERMAEDALRVLRAIRFATHFNFELESDLAQALHDHALGLTKISRERIVAELNKTFSATSPRPYKQRALKLLVEFRIWHILFSIAPISNWRQAPLDHPLTFWTLVVLSLERGAPPLKWGAVWCLSRQTSRAIEQRLTGVHWLQDPHQVNWHQLRQFWQEITSSPLLASDVRALAQWLQLDLKLFERILQNPQRIERAVTYSLVSAQQVVAANVTIGPAIGKILAEIHRRYLMFEIEAEELTPRIIRQIYETLPRF